MVKKSLKFLLSFLLLSGTFSLSATSCRNDNITSISTYKVKNIDSMVKMEGTYTIDYHFNYSSFVMLVSNSVDINNKMNNYVKASERLIYTFNYQEYYSISNQYSQLKLPKLSEINERGYLLFLDKGTVIDSVFVLDKIPDTFFEEKIESRVTNSNLYTLNIDVSNKNEYQINKNQSMSLIYETDITNKNIIFDKTSNFTKLDSSFFFNQLDESKNQTVYFSRETCGDCRNFNTKVVHEYFKDKPEKEIFYFDLFIFENFKPTNEEDQETNIYNLSREFVQNYLFAGFNYNIFDYQTKSVLKEEIVSFKFPTLVTYKNNKKVDLIVYSNDEVKKDKETDKYQVTKSFYGNNQEEIDFIFSIENYDYSNLLSVKEIFQKEKTIEYMEKYC